MSARRRRPQFTTPLGEARLAVLRFLAQRLYWFRPSVRFLIGFLLLTAITTLLLARSYSRVPAEIYQVGDVVRSSIVSPADISSIDQRETEQRQAEARAATRPLWNYDPTRPEAVAQTFRNAWRDLQRQSEAYNNSNNNAANSNTAPARAPAWRGEGGGEEVTRAIIAHRFDEGTLTRILSLLRETYDGYVFADEEGQFLAPEIRLTDVRSGSQSIVLIAQSRLTPLSEARQNIHARVARLPGWRPEEQNALAQALAPLAQPNISYDQAATEAAREAAAATVQPTTITLRRNQIIAREGEPVSARTLAQLAAISDYTRTERRYHHLIGIFIIVGALYWAAWRFTLHRSVAKVLPLSRGKAFTLIGLSVITQTLLLRVGLTLADSIATRSLSPPVNDPMVWSFAIPFAASALLIVLLVDTQLALITALLTSLFAGLLAPNGILMSLYAMISSASAIYGIGRYRERQSVTLAGLIVGGANALVAIAVILSAQQPFTLNTALLAIGCGMLGGILTAIFTAGMLPVTESAFGILTDIKLLELSNADLPVLGQMALRAPGTNQHSHAVGQLAEDACRSIGANPLLARIGALYHDIGKLAAPDMFVENQQGNNPHDRLRPTNSARIIISHVTYGLKLAKELGLPKQIRDFIPQHHGTRTLHFFLRKAQAQAGEGETVDEAEFRYPGPKPQFKEAAIMMLADSCEAAARSLARPDPENIRAIVTKIFDAIVSDGQLDECDLSLRELTSIRESIITSLTAIYHARIDYPGFNPPPHTGPLPQANLDTEERGITYSQPADIPISKGGEVEDEAVTSKGNK